jgi:hypothetical protein
MLACSLCEHSGAGEGTAVVKNLSKVLPLQASARAAITVLMLAALLMVVANVRPDSAQALSSPTWSELATFPGSFTPVAAAMAFDPVLGQVVLFGGGGTPSNQTWMFDGSTWKQIATAQNPPGLDWASMSFDPQTGSVILFGGLESSSASFETWSFDGANWSQIATLTSPPARYSAQMSFDSTTGTLILFGGVDFNGSPFDDTWALSGSTWAQLSPATSPPATWDGSAAFDPLTSSLIVFGGETGQASFGNDTWSFDGSGWTRVSTSVSPPGRFYSSMAFDPDFGGIVAFGGRGSAGDLSDTWLFDGTNWTQLSPEGLPPAREAATMSFDSASHEVILVGGNLRGDTWALSGSTGSSLPSAPTSLAVLAKPSEIDVSWSAPTSDGGSAITAYTATISHGQLSRKCVTSSTRCVFKSVATSTPWKIGVTAANQNGSGPSTYFLNLVFAVSADKLSLRIPLVVQTKQYFTALVYGELPGTAVTVGVPGSSHQCAVDSIGQCWITARVYAAGRWTAVARGDTTSALAKFYVPRVVIPLQVAKGKELITSVALAPPGCSVSETVSGKTISSTANSSGAATVKIRARSIGVLHLTLKIGGTSFKPYYVEVT